HKRAVAAACAERTPTAQRADAVNAFAFRDGRLVGHNTDVEGFDRAARRLLGDVESLSVGVLGAGGAAAAVLAAIEGWPGSQAVIVNRDADRARALVARFRSI